MVNPRPGTALSEDERLAALLVTRSTPSSRFRHRTPTPDSRT